MEMEERWLIVPGFENYEVSDLGRVRSKNNRQVLRPARSGKRDPRHTVCLYRHGKKQKVHVARLVLTAFVRPPEPGEMALHAEDDLSTDRLERLRWGTHQDNVQDARENKRYRSPAYWAGKTLSEDHRANLSKATKGRTRRPEEIAAIKAALAERRKRLKIGPSDAEVAEIRQLAGTADESGYWSERRLAQRFGISSAQAHRIVVGTAR